MTIYQILGYVLVGILFALLVYMTYRTYRPKKKPPQDHYYAERKKDE